MHTYYISSIDIKFKWRHESFLWFQDLIFFITWSTTGSNLLCSVILSEDFSVGLTSYLLRHSGRVFLQSRSVPCYRILIMSMHLFMSFSNSTHFKCSHIYVITKDDIQYIALAFSSLVNSRKILIFYNIALLLWNNRPQNSITMVQPGEFLRKIPVFLYKFQEWGRGVCGAEGACSLLIGCP